MLGKGDIRLPLVYIDDMVDAIVSAADGNAPSGSVVQLVDPYTPTQNEVLDLTGGNSKVVRLARPLVFLLGKCSELALWPLKRPSPLSTYRLKSALARRTFRSVNAESVLNWAPRVGAREGVRRVTGPTFAVAGYDRKVVATQQSIQAVCGAAR
jgi:nucleoside-diphosphate-sugar epimerase